MANFFKKAEYQGQVPFDKLIPNSIFLKTNEISEALFAIFLKKQFKNIKKFF